MAFKTEEGFAGPALSRDEVEARLRTRSENISLRIEALQAEVGTLGEAIREAVFRNPLVGLGGAIVLGAVVGLLFGKKKPSGEYTRAAVPGSAGAAHRALVDAYVDAVVEHARRGARSGKDVGRAVRDALSDRVPLIVVAPEESKKKVGFITDMMQMALSAAAGMAVRTGMDALANKLVLKDIIEHENAVVDDAEPHGASETAL